jgi:hypothetical protein
VRLRTARKLRNAVGTPRECCYATAQLETAMRRCGRTASARSDRLFFDTLMRALGPEGRAYILSGTGRPDWALDLLMRTPEHEWEGSPAALQQLRGEE